MSNRLRAIFLFLTVTAVLLVSAVPEAGPPGEAGLHRRFPVRLVPDRQGNPHLRMSFHCYNIEDDIERAFKTLDKLG